MQQPYSQGGSYPAAAPSGYPAQQHQHQHQPQPQYGAQQQYGQPAYGGMAWPMLHLLAVAGHEARDKAHAVTALPEAY